MSLVLIILVVLILFGGLGGGYYGYRGGYYGPGMYGGVGLVVILLIVLLLFSGIGGLAGTVVSHAALVEINPGLWVCPTRVAMVVARNGVPSRVGPDVPPNVRVMVDGDPSIGWEFDTWDAAVAFAAKLAARINEAMRHYGP